jgi:hypothetical protein
VEIVGPNKIDPDTEVSYEAIIDICDENETKHNWKDWQVISNELHVYLCKANTHIECCP